MTQVSPLILRIIPNDSHRMFAGALAVGEHFTSSPLVSLLSCTVDCSLTSRGKSFHLELRIGAVAALVSHF